MWICAQQSRGSEEMDEEQKLGQASTEMSTNSSFSSNSSLDSACPIRDIAVITAAPIMTKLVLLPPCFLVLYVGYRRWRRQHPSAMTNHSDAITYHVVTMQMVVLLGNVLFCISPYANLPELRDVGTATYQIFQRGQILFHCLTAVDRYLAVVHPITYLGMKTERVVRIRNIVIGCVWVFSFGWFSVIKQDPVSRMVTFLVFMVSSLIVVSFCSISVLRALIRPGPGQGGGETGRVDQSKQRAFYAMMAITGALSFWFVGYLVATLLILSRTLNDYDACILTYSDFWFTLPSSLVIPLLFLQRAGKLRCCC